MLAYWDRDLVCRVANPAYQTWLGVPSQRLKGMSLPELLGPELFSLNAPFVRAALAGEEQIFERVVPGPDGHPRHSLARYIPDVVDGQVQGFVAYVTEVTVLARREQTLRTALADCEVTRSKLVKSEESLRQAQRLGRIGSWEWEIDADITSWSDELYRIFGRDPRRLPPSFAEHAALYASESWAELQAAVSQAVATGERYQLQLRYRHLDGTYGWLEACGEAALDETGRAVLLRGTAQEITLRRELAETRVRQVALASERRQERAALLDEAARRIREEMNRRSAAEDLLARTGQMALLGQLTSGVAHDFNNVLAGISGAFHVLERTVCDGVQQDCVRRGKRAVERATRLVRQLMGFASTQAFQPEAIDVAEALEQARDMIEPALGPRVQLHIDVSCRWRALADARLLEVALLNLAINARDAMPDGGVFCVQCRDLGADAPERPDRLVGDFVAISATDTGTGMSPQVLARVREPFFTTKPMGSGTGLGLPMVDGFALQSGGRFVLVSEPGKGTSATIYLPRARPGDMSTQDRAAAAHETTSLQGHGGATILVVDDDPLVRPVASQYLRDLGYAVVEAEDALHALALADAPDAFDLVLVDVVMPVLDGVHLVEKLRQWRPDLPILMMTGHADRSRLAGEEVLDKPFTPEQLGQRVLKLLGRLPPTHALAARFRTAAMRHLYERWTEAYEASGKLPAASALDLDRCDGNDCVFVAEIESLSPFGFHRIRTGATLQAMAGDEARSTAQSAPSDAEPFVGLEAAYLRCVRLREPSYEYLKLRQAGGAPMLFERLLLPCADATGRATLLIGMVIIQNMPGT